MGESNFEEEEELSSGYEDEDALAEERAPPASTTSIDHFMKPKDKKIKLQLRGRSPQQERLHAWFGEHTHLNK
jgi:hypothetical protein